MYHLNLGPQTAATAQYTNSAYELQAVIEAQGLWERAYGRGQRNRLWSLITRRSRRLLDLAKVQTIDKVAGRHYLGLQTVSIGQIRGTENRSHDFDANFLPLQAHDQERWRGVAAAWLMGKALPPVELLQVEDIYFVQDGHHRISIARMLGQQEIEAMVTVWQLDRPLTVMPVVPGSAHHPGLQPLWDLLTKTATMIKPRQILAKLQLF